MKKTRLIQLAALIAVMGLAACEKPTSKPDPEPNSPPITVLDTLPPDTVWVSPPYDTAAALEGRVWRAEKTWPEWHREGNTIQMQLHGYAVTTTMQENNRFYADVVLSSNQRYFEYFPLGVSGHRYLYCPEWSTYDSTLYLLPLDTPMEADTNPSQYLEIMGVFHLYDVTDTSLFLYSGGHATEEHLRAFTFKKL